MASISLWSQARSVRGLIFDIDGTLLHSNDAHALTWTEAFAAAGHDIPFERVRPLIGMGGGQILRRLLGLPDDVGEGARLAASRRRSLERELPALRPTRGARALLEALRARGIPLAVATSAEPDEARALLGQAGLADLLPLPPGAQDAETSKPAPDVVEVALHALGLPPGDVALVGDTPYDVEAARRAGVRAVALRCGGAPERALEGAWAVLDDPRDLLRHLDTVLAGRSPEASEPSESLEAPESIGQPEPPEPPEAPEPPGAGSLSAG